MPGAKTSLVDYISQKFFAKANKVRKFILRWTLVVATIFKIPNSFKHLIEHKPQKLQKLDSILKLSSLLLKSTRSIAPQTPNFIYDSSQIQNKAIASHSPTHNPLL